MLILMNILGISGIGIPFYLYILLVVVYLGVSVAASFFIGSGFHMKVICSGETVQKVVALTFDDGPDPNNTEAILDILKGQAKATFFCIGRNIPGNEAILEKMNREEHLIGMHSFSHSKWFDFFSPSKMRKEFLATEELIFTATGKKPLLFRPPYGVLNPMVKKALHSFRYHVIGFSNRSLDTVTADEDKVIKRVLRKLRPGDIILLHDTVYYSASLLKKLLFELSERGYIVIGLDELCKIRAYEN
jgi:peptidoglycan-N-acetylglucosamine deacetylase